MLDDPVNMQQLFQAKESDPEGAELRPFAALQRHTRRRLQTDVKEFLATLNLGVLGVGNNNARRLKARRRYTRKTARLEQSAYLGAEQLLLGAQVVKAVRACFQHDIAQHLQRIRRHRRVIHVAARFIGLHDLQPLAQITRETAALRLINPGAGALT